MFGQNTPVASLRVGDQVRTGRNLKTIIEISRAGKNIALKLDNGNTMTVGRDFVIIAVKAGA